MLSAATAPTVNSSHQRSRRQLSIDDLISKALSLVRPIFDTSQPLQYDEMLKKQAVQSTDDLRESTILGLDAPHPLDHIPLCKGNNKICQFISCSAENFKKDPTFGNLQLAAQVLSDRKLRQTISSNPEAIDAVCKEQGMDDGQCKLFSNGFQLIDKFITTIESKTQTRSDGAAARRSSPGPTRPPGNDILMDDAEYVVEPAPGRAKVFGSKTWSSQPDQGQRLFEIRNDLIASFTPLPPAPFMAPTPPQAPPLAFPTMPSLIISPISPSGLTIDKLPLMKVDPGIRRQRSIDWDSVDLVPDMLVEQRVKRDYYDDAKPSDPSSSSLASSPSALSSTTSTDYYGSIADATSTRGHGESSPLQSCVHILSIY